MARLHDALRSAAGSVRPEGKSQFAIFSRNGQTFPRYGWPVLAALLVSPTSAVTAQEATVKDNINVGIAESASPQLKKSAAVDKSLKLEPNRRFEFADHVANGVAMRNRTAGTIHLRGAPVPSRVLVALLYFNFSDGAREGRRSMPVLFDANLIPAEKTGDHDDPCWGMTGNHSYVADVTRTYRRKSKSRLQSDHPI